MVAGKLKDFPLFDLIGPGQESRPRCLKSALVSWETRTLIRRRWIRFLDHPVVWKTAAVEEAVRRRSKSLFDLNIR